MGGYTAGPDGSCAGDDDASSWRAYLSLAPRFSPGDARLVDLHLNRDLTLDVDVG